MQTDGAFRRYSAHYDFSVLIHKHFRRDIPFTAVKMFDLDLLHIVKIYQHTAPHSFIGKYFSSVTSVGVSLKFACHVSTPFATQSSTICLTSS